MTSDLPNYPTWSMDDSWNGNTINLMNNEVCYKMYSMKILGWRFIWYRIRGGEFFPDISKEL